MFLRTMLGPEGPNVPLPLVLWQEAAQGLVMDIIERVPDLGGRAARVRQLMADKRAEARAWTRSHGEDAPEVADWVRPT